MLVIQSIVDFIIRESLLIESVLNVEARNLRVGISQTLSTVHSDVVYVMVEILIILDKPLGEERRETEKDLQIQHHDQLSSRTYMST